MSEYRSLKGTKVKFYNCKEMKKRIKSLKINTLNFLANNILVGKSKKAATRKLIDTSFYENIINDPKINKKIPVNKIKKLFNFSYHTKRIDIIFKRSLKK